MSCVLIFSLELSWHPDLFMRFQQCSQIQWIFKNSVIIGGNSSFDCDTREKEIISVDFQIAADIYKKHDFYVKEM